MAMRCLPPLSALESGPYRVGRLVGGFEAFCPHGAKAGAAL